MKELLRLCILLVITGIARLSKNTGVYASVKDEEITEKRPTFKAINLKNAGFLEQFTENWKERWTVSSALRRVDGNDTFFYVGKWKVEEPRVHKGIIGDKGLVLKNEAAHHAISAKFDKPINNKGKTLVIQYEVMFQNRLECGGAYLKLITESSEDIHHKEFSDKTPYTIMFGPDKCGVTNKVHFIFRHKNPITDEYEEKHLRSPPAIDDSKYTTLYTLIVRPDQSYEVRINNKVSKSGNLLTDFEPPVNPEKFIVDPLDKKPDDWVDQAKIPDPNAKKPDDWDENEPYEILNTDAVKPTDWLEDEPSMIPDPDVKPPEEWNEEDGEFIAPLIPNPLCKEASGCGPFKPMIRNPKYKGKWRPPLINNPKYVGEWKPRNIPNPAYFEDNSPSDFETIVGVGFELWTMQSDILFDNIYIGHSVEEAEQLAKNTFQVKYEFERKEEKEVPPAPETVLNNVPKETYFDTAIRRVVTFVDLAKTSPVSAIKQMPGTASTIGVVFVTFIALLFGLVTLVSSGHTSTAGSEKVKGGHSKSNKASKDDHSKSDEAVKDDLSEDAHNSSEQVISKKRSTRRTE
ncbi:hypothetical protein T552_00409 [Pneumocystis carinii B80]|uniref:Calnexin n=1 Tax=Pneumocystis carinii (strain B80) TaxID=1408658 RepID=A0A0W4ZQP1_PNEC8|nr:hypothetical protein T552_00409 [Pneumocystis carinii B80]KTW30697.1 hypothetical protein T552_00409 [Pneumocystis carinii B80]